MFIKEGEVGLGGDQTLVGGEMSPMSGFDIVQWNALAVTVQYCEIVLGIGLAALRGNPKPMCRLVEILRHARASVI